MFVNKIRSILSLYGKSLADWARQLGIFPQSLNNKLNSNSVKVIDLIALCEMIDCNVSIVKDDKIIMTFDKEDFVKEPRE